MINRHSSSLSISTFLHIIILAIFLNIDFAQKKPDEDEKRIAVYVCTFKQEQEKAKEEAKKIEQPPKEIKQNQSKPKQNIQKAAQVQPFVEEATIKMPEPTKDNGIQILQNTTKKETIPTHTDTKESSDMFQSKKEPSLYSDDYLALNKDSIYTLIKENLYYPLSARKRGIEGLVVLKFILTKRAEVCNVQVIESSSDILSNAAIKTIEELSKKFPSPKEDITITLPIEYKLN